MNFDINEALAQKLPDTVLRQFTKKKTEEKTSVIVELDLPPQKIFLGKRQLSRTMHEYGVEKVVEESAAQQKENARKIQKTRKFLESLLGTTPHWLNAARAFVVTVTPEQLREMAQFPLTRTIRLNRRSQKTG